MKRLLRRAFDATLKSSDVYKRFRNKTLYPGLRVCPSANLDISGTFSYDHNVSVCTGSNLIVPRAAKLHIGNQCHIGRYVELGPSRFIEIGDFTSIQDRSIFVGDIQIGRYCLFSLNVLITSGHHHFDIDPSLLIRDQDAMFAGSVTTPASDATVTIHDDCWIGVNSVILPEVSVGKGCIIGANSVVTQSLPPYSIVAGAPARVIRKRLDFIPPKMVLYNNKEDYPYFYSGIELSSKERADSNYLGGLLTKDSFQLCLDTKRYSKVVLRIKTTKGTTWISHGEGKEEIGDQFEEVSFHVQGDGRNLIRFRDLNGSKKSRLVLQKAWLE